MGWALRVGRDLEQRREIVVIILGIVAEQERVIGEAG